MSKKKKEDSFEKNEITETNIPLDIEGRAAPSNTSWSTKGSGKYRDRIGIHISTSNTKTQTTVTATIWYWTIVHVEDSNNEFYYDWDTYANTLAKRNVTINHPSNGKNDTWPLENQTKIYSASRTFNRGKSKTTVNFSAGVSGIDFVGHSNFFYINIDIPSLDKYTITYNANGGTGAPGSQSAYHGQSIALSSTKPTREGAKFLGWSTSSSANSVTHNPGGSYTFTGNTTLYAVWETNDYTVSYDANGGTNAPASQIKKHGTNINISSQTPTRENYNFLGWASSPTSSIPIYQPGDVYSANSSITLYAVWELGYSTPRITGLTADRCTQSGALDEEGTYAKVSFNWEADYSVNSIKIEWKSKTESYWNSSQVYDYDGSVSQVVGSNLDTEMEYDIKVTVRDSNGESIAEIELSSIAFELDLLGGGGGVSIGKPATKKGFEVNYPTTFENSVVDKYGTSMITGLAKEGASEDPNTTLEHSIVTSINTPNNEKMYVTTYFHGRKSVSDNRVQCAYPYSGEDTEYVRHYENNSWTNWKRVGEENPKEKILWQPSNPNEGIHMNNTQTITLTENLTSQKYGIILVWSGYDLNPPQHTLQTDWFYTFVPKWHHIGGGVHCTMTGHWNNIAKYVYVFEKTIKGHESNGVQRTMNGVDFYNSKAVLRKVLGV